MSQDELLPGDNPFLKSESLSVIMTTLSGDQSETQPPQQRVLFLDTTSIDITATIEAKLKALELHRTQTASMNYLGAVEGLNEYRGVMSMTGKYAEAFEVISIGFNL